MNRPEDHRLSGKLLIFGNGSHQFPIGCEANDRACFPTRGVSCGVRYSTTRPREVIYASASASSASESVSGFRFRLHATANCFPHHLDELSPSLNILLFSRPPRDVAGIVGIMRGLNKRPLEKHHYAKSLDPRGKHWHQHGFPKI